MLPSSVHKQAVFKHHVWMSADVAWPNWNCSRTISISQEQMLRAQIYKRRIAACNPIALLAPVWHQKCIWGCLMADNRLSSNGDAGAWTINILSILEIFLCLKCLLCRWMDTPFSFSADRQRTGNIHSGMSVQNDVSMGKSGQPPQNPQKP